jgi:hypothetical protein
MGRRINIAVSPVGIDRREKSIAKVIICNVGIGDKTRPNVTTLGLKCVYSICAIEEYIFQYTFFLRGT